jgi:hypothetical protein
MRTCRILIEDGADINVSNRDGETAIDVAKKEVKVFLSFMLVGPALLPDEKEMDLFYSAFNACVGGRFS